MLDFLKYVKADHTRREPFYDDIIGVTASKDSILYDGRYIDPAVDVYKCTLTIRCEVKIVKGLQNAVTIAVEEASKRIRMTIFRGFYDRLFKVERLLMDRNATQALVEVQAIRRELTEY